MTRPKQALLFLGWPSNTNAVWHLMHHVAQALRSICLASTSNK